MTLRELINQVTNNQMDLSEPFVELDYQLHFLDMDDNKRSMNLIARDVITVSKNRIIEIEVESIK